MHVQVTIQRGTSRLGQVDYDLRERAWLKDHTHQQLLDRIFVALAGRAAEQVRLVCGHCQVKPTCVNGNLVNRGAFLLPLSNAQGAEFHLYHNPDTYPHHPRAQAFGAADLLLEPPWHFNVVDPNVRHFLLHAASGHTGQDLHRG
jgi:hypothetical protein